MEDLLFAQGVKAFGFVGGVRAASIGDPRRNLTGDPYFTDGLGVVIELTTTPTDLNGVEFLEWERP